MMKQQEHKMARETKAQRLAREAAERAAYGAERAATYPQRLMKMLERATSVNFEIKVRDGKFLLTDSDDPREGVVELTLAYDSEINEAALNELDWRVDIKEEAEREALRRVQIRNAALAKLSQEERTILGI